MKGLDREGLGGGSERRGRWVGCRSFRGAGADGGAEAEFVVGLLPLTEGLAPDLGWLGPD